MRQLTGLDEALAWLARRESGVVDPGVSQVVADVIAQVAERGDDAILELGRRFDAAPALTIRVDRATLEAAHDGLDVELLAAIRLAAGRIRHYYSQQQEAGFSFQEHDARLMLLSRPIGSVGIYVPGGQAPLFSTLLMTAVPAQVAGVPRIAVATPPGSNGLPHATVLATAFELGLDEVYAIGGAQAMAALALGSQSVARVDKLVGPGNSYVTEAKRQLYGRVGIEALAGPTETLVLADSSANPGHVIADLLAQAEHDGAVPVLVTDSAELMEAVLDGLETALADLPTAAAARESLDRRGAAILVEDVGEALQVSNTFAPEHLCLLVDRPESLLDRIHNAGGVFLGHDTMEALGDYVAGPSHVMPTGGSARFASFVNVSDFRKLMPVLGSSPRLLELIGPAGALLARSEGLEAHARAIESRLGKSS